MPDPPDPRQIPGCLQSLVFFVNAQGTREWALAVPLLHEGRVP